MNGVQSGFVHQSNNFNTVFFVVKKEKLFMNDKIYTNGFSIPRKNDELLDQHDNFLVRVLIVHSFIYAR